MPNFRLTLSYDGTDFHGWQTQPGLRTVQETLERALAQVTGQPRVRVNASGRTDTGVHAVGQVVNAHAATKLNAATLRRAVNANLPEDVVVRAAEVVADDFDANRHAVGKHYRYVLHDGDVPDLFQRRYCHHCRWKLDADAMGRAAAVLLGTHDFRCFETEWPNRASSVRTVTRLDVRRDGDWVRLDVEADGFLYNMVRAIAGTLMNVGRGYWPQGHVARVLASGERAEAGPTAPARGLFLVRVYYERD
ncbi:MAG: tRNA pseudouridine(38-40) synthase TruA [Gemmataceae bacterium]